jgi:hypothetical protein
VRSRQQICFEQKAAQFREAGTPPEVFSCGENFNHSPRYASNDVSLTAIHE